MKDSEVTIKIAELLGWTNIFESCDGYVFLGMHPTQSMGRDYSEVPNYSSDLNAVYEVEETFSEDQQNDYYHHIADVTGGRLIHVTALERCKAILKLFEKEYEN
jgi:hypothetical protein